MTSTTLSGDHQSGALPLIDDLFRWLEQAAPAREPTRQCCWVDRGACRAAGDDYARDVQLSKYAAIWTQHVAPTLKPHASTAPAEFGKLAKLDAKSLKRWWAHKDSNLGPAD